VEPNNNQDDASSTSEVSSRASQPTSCVKTSPIKKKRQVIVVEVSLLKGTEGPNCRADPLVKEVCCLPGALVKDVKRKFPTLVRSSDCPPLFQVGRS